jgi:phosphoglycolate phosphatase
MIKYIIFDFDGTLADSKAIFLSVYNDIAAKRQFRPITTDNLAHLRTLSIAQRCKYLKVPMLSIPFLSSEFLNAYRSLSKQIRLFDGISELLSQLKSRGYELAVISSNSEKNIFEILHENQVTDISKVYCSTSLFGKDRLIKGFLKKYNLKKDEILYIGDEQRDIIACKNTGVKIVWVAWGYDTQAFITSDNPDYIALKPSDILGFLTPTLPT